MIKYVNTLVSFSEVPDEISTKFDTNTECHSAQLLIIKYKENAK